MEAYCDTASKAMNAREEYSVCRTAYHVRQESFKVSPGYVNCNIRTLLTPEVCSKLITQIIKYVVSYKLIPFSYEALKLKATADLTVEAGCISRKTVQAKNHQRKIRDAYTILESIFKNISDEMEDSTTEDAVEEVALLLGATTYSPREIYKILVPPLMYNELSASQQAVQSRGLLQWFRYIVMSEELNRLLNRSLTTTNMYVLLKRRVGKESAAFIPKDGYSLPRCGHQFVIDLTNAAPSPSDMELENTSSDMELESAAAEDALAKCHREPVCKTSVNSELSVKDSNCNMSCQDSCWFQSKFTFKGFKAS